MSRSAILTSSESEPAPSFSITGWRWIFTFVSLTPSLLATCLFGSPATTSAHDDPEDAELLDGIGELVEVDRVDDMGVHAEPVAAFASSVTTVGAATVPTAMPYASTADAARLDDGFRRGALHLAGCAFSRTCLVPHTPPVSSHAPARSIDANVLTSLRRSRRRSGSDDAQGRGFEYEILGGCNVATIVEYESTLAPRRTPVSRRVDDDAQLVQSLRRGEPAAADRLIVTYQSRAYRLAFGITGNAQDAEEVVQDSFCSVVRKIDTFRGEAAFGSWLYRIVANAAYQKLRGRRRQREEITLDEVLPVFDGKGRHARPCTDWSAAVDDPCRNIELRLALMAALEELPAHYRTALVLRDVEGLAVAEIAETLGLSVENVKSRVHRARLFVRKRLTESPAVRLVV